MAGLKGIKTATEAARKAAQVAQSARMNSRGQPVHPTAEGQENFSRWFRESKMADTEGRPTLAYTGTSKDVPFKKFNVPRNGTWFTSDPKDASGYAVQNDSMNLRRIPGTHRFEEVNTASRVIPAYLRVENPYSLTAEDLDRMRKAPNYRREQGIIFDRLRREGYDGVDMGDGITVVIGNPQQIKSAIGNQGTFGDVDDIAMANGGGIEMAKGGKLGALARASSAIRQAAAEAPRRAAGAQDVLPAGPVASRPRTIVYHGSPAGPIVGAPRLTPHSETGLPVFSVSRGKENAQRYANDEFDMHWEVDEINPTITPFEIKGRVAEAGKFMDRVKQHYGVEMPTHQQILDYAQKRGVVGLDQWRNLGGQDDISVLFPEALVRVDPQDFAKGGKVGALSSIRQAVSRAASEASAPRSGIDEILQAQQPPMTTPRGTGLPLMPRSQGMYTPGIPQVDLPRMPMVDRARAAGTAPKYTPRMQDLLDSDKARRKVNRLIDKGEELGMRDWYGTEPLRQVAMDVGLSPQNFQELLAQLASASQRNPVDQQNKMGSYLWHLSRTGQLPEDAFLMTNKIREGKAPRPEGTPIELPPGYGSLAQGDIFSRGKQIAFGDIEGALPPERKLGTFYRNLQGNLRPVTVDVNAVRGPVIEVGDPRWLASKLVEKDDKGEIIGTHFPRRDVASGLMSLRQAQQRPGFWEAAPSGSEYAGFEDLWQRAARRKDVAPAEAQALGWYGSADVTALKTAPELYVDNLEQLIRDTASKTGQSPTETMRRFLLGEEPLQSRIEQPRGRADGGAIEGDASAPIKAFKSDKEANAWFDGIPKATGGAVTMAQGGMPQLGNVSEQTVPDSSDSGMLKYQQGYADGGAATVNPIMERRAAREREGKDQSVGNVVSALGELATDQAKEEAASMNARGVTDVINRGLIADTLGSPVDLINWGFQGVDYLREKATGKPVVNRLGSEVPVGGSQQIRDLFDRYGITSGVDRPMMETAMALFGPGRVASAVRRAKASLSKP
jgi:hypothetical protein